MPPRPNRSQVGACSADTIQTQSSRTSQPPTDIDKCIAFSLSRLIFSILGLLIAISDIPRTGWRPKTGDFYPEVAPNVLMYYGPYAYPVIHIRRDQSLNASEFMGNAGSDSVDAVQVWSYKFDSVFIPMRALAQRLELQSFDPCIMYHGECNRSELGVATVFSMLDELIMGIVRQYFHDRETSTQPLHFHTRSVWSDRLHHVVSPFWPRIDNRLYWVHHVHLRNHTTPTRERILLCSMTPHKRPFICDHPIPWRVGSMQTGGAEQHPSLSEHVDIRVGELMQQYPNIELDVIVFVGRSVMINRQKLFPPTISFVSDNIEVTTLIRGCRREHFHGECIADFVEDYRYERATLETNADEWSYWTSALRLISQMYIWIRITFLWWGCFIARSAEEKHRRKSLLSRVLVTWGTFFRIPSHIATHGNLLPIIGYSLAHWIDCGLVHFISDNAWASVNGFVDFDPLKYFFVASIQLRNAWLLALSWKVGLFGLRFMLTPRRIPWSPSHGMISIRFTLISMVSGLTIFSYLRAVRFRDCRVVSMTEFPRVSTRNGRYYEPFFSNAIDFDYRLDFKTSVMGTILTVVFGFALKLIVRAITGSSTSIFCCRSYYVPFSAGTVWSLSKLDFLWSLQIRSNCHGAIPERVARPSECSSSENGLVNHLVNSRRGSITGNICCCDVGGMNWPEIQGCPQHVRFHELHYRSKCTWSVVRLVNIAHFSDPWVLASLYMRSRPTLVCQIGRSLNEPGQRRKLAADVPADTDCSRRWRHAFYLPISINFNEEDADQPPQLEILAVVKSSDLQWQTFGVRKEQRCSIAGDDIVNVASRTTTSSSLMGHARAKSMTEAPRSRGGTCVVRDAFGKHEHRIQPPESDVDSYVAFSISRCLLSVIGILLVTTDIPRTGFSIALADYFAFVEPGTTMYYGPYDYHVIHINRTGAYQSPSSGSTDSEFNGSSSGVSTDTVDLWGYKFDSLSIPPRAMAEHLNVRAFPSCLLYKSPCSGSSLPISTVFEMLDELVTAIQTKYYPGHLANFTSSTIPVVFDTVSNWMDRLHHVIVSFVSEHRDKRIHTIHFYGQYAPGRNGICRQLSNRPLMCDHRIGWYCTHPFLELSRPIPFWEHIDARFEVLRQEHPGLELDLTVITTRFVTASHPSGGIVPGVAYSSDNIEMTTYIRGRLCEHTRRECRTVFVDDYRYERASMESNLDEWLPILTALRGLSQLYVWVRLLSLAWGCYRARSSEAKYQHARFTTRVTSTLFTFLKIPSHVIIYSSWFPISAYSLAHIIDCGMMHLVSDNIWASSNGFVDFDLLRYIRVASIQMRNVWLVAFTWKLLMLAYTVVSEHRGRPWTPRRGILGVRGSFISVISWLTIFSFLRALHFRDTRVIAVHELSRTMQLGSLGQTPTFINTVDFGIRLDIKTTLVTTALVTGGGLLAQRLVLLLTRQPTSFFFCRTHYVPFSAGTLFPKTMLNIFWFLDVTPARESLLSALRRSVSIGDAVRELSHRLMGTTTAVSRTRSQQQPQQQRAPFTKRCDVCHHRVTVVHWRRVQGCVCHQELFHVDRRAPEICSMVRLTNVGLLSDPWVLLRVYVLGEPLYLFRITPEDTSRVFSARRPHLLLHHHHSPAAIAPTPAASASSSVEAEIPEPPRSFLRLLPVMIDRRSRFASRANAAIGAVAPGTRVELLAVIDSRTVPWSVLVDVG